MAQLLKEAPAWRRAILYTHRWLGIVGGPLFVLWFSSGIVMMYARMPRLSAEERLWRLSPLDLGRAQIEPAAAASSLGWSPERLRIGMLGERPVYRFRRGSRWTVVFADDGEPLHGLSADAVERLVRRSRPEHADTVRYETFLERPDQWTLQIGAFLPLHRLALGDPDDTRLYVSDRTGEAVMLTTRSSRRWGYLGAVLHWLYFTPLRSHSTLWLQSLIWISIAGCVLSLSGLVWGLTRFSPRRRYDDSRSRSPYSGLLKWHHYAGLIFGLATFTWVLSGCLSLDPWDWHPSTSPTEQQVRAMAGGRLHLESLTLESLRAGVATIAADFSPRELEVVQFMGEPFLSAYRAPSFDRVVESRNPEVTAFLSPTLSLDHRVVSVESAHRGTFARFERSALVDAARAAMPGSAVEDVAWLEAYDNYYYDRYGARTLPVLRVRFADPPRTWLYLDPRRAVILHKEERLSRLNRWLYKGLHRLDFPFLYYRRPLWDIVVITLSLGGLLVSGTTLLPAWLRLRRHARR